MRIEDLNHKELLEMDSAGGLIHFAGHRALLLDAVAMGLHRKYLVENFGTTAARAVLTQFGFAHGWRMAAAMKDQLKWDSETEWRRAGPRLFTLEGLFLAQPGSEDTLTQSGAMLSASYEAEQHVLHFGRADSAVCWTICGLMSGYVSQTTGTEIYVLEDRCLAHGDAACHIRGRTREAWGEEHEADLAFFDKGRLQESLDVSLSRVIASLKIAETKLYTHRKALNRVEQCTDDTTSILTRSGAMQVVVDLARRVAKVDAAVLITGESGAGKERLARLVHDDSSRSLGPFIAINCGAIAESLLESELFGHARGAFTGATSDRPGLFEAANGGTLLLDEIGEVSPGMQVKLLRVLQEKEVRRVGENRSRPVNARVIAATNRDLAQSVEQNLFRQDLYYRLKVVELRVPPLRERRADILPLARVMLADAAIRMGRTITGFTPKVADQLLRYDWPGNVRELANAIERAVALELSDRLELDGLPEEVRQAFPKPVLTSERVPLLWDVEKDYILAVLKQNDGNQTRTAKQIGIGAATLQRKLKLYRADAV